MEQSHCMLVLLMTLVAVVPTADALAATLAVPETLERMRELHEREIGRGLETFSTAFTGTNRAVWSDVDFIGHGLGDGNTGSEAMALPKSGTTLFESKRPVITPRECQEIVAEAKEIIATGLELDEPALSSNGRSRTNSQLGEATLSSMPKARDWLQRALRERLLPLLEDRFGVNEGDLALYDGLVLGHQAPSKYQPIHRDASLLTLNIALSALTDYTGGGTYMEAIDRTLKIDQGHLLCHASGAMHAGVGITRGERWVLVLFVLATNQPQLARRCHAEALLALQDDDYPQAQHFLDAGLSIAPQEHLLHFTMGRLHLARNNSRLALQSFRSADRSYPHCPKSLVSMAQILMDQRRPRAALRWFDTLLDARIQDSDLRPDSLLAKKSLAWAARKDAARCALLGAHYLHRQRHENYMPTEDRWCEWSCHHLPVAVERIRTCLVPAPNDPDLLGMLERAQYFLENAQGAPGISS